MTTSSPTSGSAEGPDAAVESAGGVASTHAGRDAQGAGAIGSETATHGATSTVDVWYRKLAGHGLLYAERRLLDQGELAAVLDGVRRRLRREGFVLVAFALVYVPLIAMRLAGIGVDGAVQAWLSVLTDGLLFSYWCLRAWRNLRASGQLRELNRRLEAGDLSADDVLATLDGH